MSTWNKIPRINYLIGTLRRFGGRGCGVKNPLGGRPTLGGMGVPGLCDTGPGILDLGGVLTEDGGLRGRGSGGRGVDMELIGGLGTLLGRGPRLGPGLGNGGDIFC